MKKLFNNNSGFTLAEVLIAAGISSLVALVAYTTLQSSQKVVKVSTVGAEVSDLKSQLIVNLGQADICNANFVGKAVTQTDIAALYTRKRETDPDGTYNLKYAGLAENIFLAKNTHYGKAATKSIYVTKISTFPTIIPRTSPVVTNPNSMTIKVDFDVVGTPVKKDSFSFDVFIGQNAGIVVSCFTDMVGMVRAAVRGACHFDADETPVAPDPVTNDNGAVYNPQGLYGTCTHPAYELRNSANTLLPPGSGVKGELAQCEADEYMYEVVVTPGSVVSGVTRPGFSTYKCRKIALASACPANESMTGINSNGTPICKSIPQNMTDVGDPIGNYMVISTKPGTPIKYKEINMNCPNPDEVLRRINMPAGTPDCIKKVMTQGCPAGEVVYDLAANGAALCRKPLAPIGAGCPSGYYLKAVNADGSIPAGGCAQLVINASCAGSEHWFMTGIDSGGNAVCEFRYR